ncbi:MAG: porin family protein [Cyclobacteriaceae bacterium]
MKTRLTTLSAILVISLLSLAINQQGIAQQSNKRVGIKGGLNVSNLFIDNVTDENARLGFHLGLFGQLFSSDVFAIQPELLYSTKGSKAQYTSGAFYQDVQYNLNYLELPVLAVFKLGESVEIQAGGYASYLLNANISYQGDIANGADEIDKDNLTSFDYGLSGGLGYNFKAVQVGVRYNYGLVQIADSDAARAAIGNSKNSCAQLYLAINLGN